MADRSARVLTPVALFEFGNLATTLLILRATDLPHADTRSLTAATTLAVLLYAAHNAAATAASFAGGQVADRLNPRVVLAGGAVVYVASYALFAVPSTVGRSSCSRFCRPVSA